MTDYSYQFRKDGVFVSDLDIPTYYRSVDITNGFKRWALQLSSGESDEYNEIVLLRNNIIINRYHYNIEPMIKSMIDLDLI